MIIGGGLSGAEVVAINSATVIKRGGQVEKTIAQGRWIMKNTTPDLPMVFELTSDGYVMERLNDLNCTEVRATDVVRLLRRSIWSRPAVTPTTPETLTALRDKVQRNTLRAEVVDRLTPALYQPVLSRAVDKAYEKAVSVKPSLTHGDPTAENVMNRSGYGPVLTDPIEATVTVPDSPCVDVGKMLQSAYGWETAKYGVPKKTYTPKDVYDALGDDELYAGGQAWAVVHVVRAIPYVCRKAPGSLARVLDVLDVAIKEGGFKHEVVL